MKEGNCQFLTLISKVYEKIRKYKLHHKKVFE